MPTRGQVKRALQWSAYLATPRRKRNAKALCVSCGAPSDRMMAFGEPGFPCRHEPLFIDAETLDRARLEFGPIEFLEPPKPSRRRTSRSTKK